MPWAAWALPDTRPSVMKTHVKANAEDDAQAEGDEQRRADRSRRVRKPTR